MRRGVPDEHSGNGRSGDGCLFEDEVAADRLAEQGQLDAGALDAEVRAGGHVDAQALAADLELLGDGGRRRVECDAECPRERHAAAWDQEGDVCAQRACDPACGDQEEPVAVRDRKPGRGIVADEEVNAGGPDTDELGRPRAGRRRRADLPVDLLEREGAGEGLAAERERRRSLDLQRVRRDQRHGRVGRRRVDLQRRGDRKREARDVDGDGRGRSTDDTG